MQNVSLEIRTIRMRSDLKPSDKNDEILVAQERYLRKQAYANTIIKVDASFFDDSDMRSDYFLTLIYDKISQTPLLSSRYYFDKEIIQKYLNGDAGKQIILSYKGQVLELKGNVFLADRLSGNVKSNIYRKNRSDIFSLYYSTIVEMNPQALLLLMARKERGDKQLNKYIDLGFEMLGSTQHKGKEHSIIVGDMKTWKQRSSK
jgi:hypothetical protein